MHVVIINIHIPKLITLQFCYLQVPDIDVTFVFVEFFQLKISEPLFFMFFTFYYHTCALECVTCIFQNNSNINMVHPKQQLSYIEAPSYACKNFRIQHFNN